MCAFFLVDSKIIFFIFQRIFFATTKPVHITRTKFRLYMAVPNDRFLLRNPKYFQWDCSFSPVKSDIFSLIRPCGSPENYIPWTFVRAGNCMSARHFNTRITGIIIARHSYAHELMQMKMLSFPRHYNVSVSIDSTQLTSFNSHDIVRMHAKMQRMREANRHIPTLRISSFSQTSHKGNFQIHLHLRCRVNANVQICEWISGKKGVLCVNKTAVLPTAGISYTECFRSIQNRGSETMNKQANRLLTHDPVNRSCWKLAIHTCHRRSQPNILMVSLLHNFRPMGKSTRSTCEHTDWNCGESVQDNPIRTFTFAL